MTTVSDSRTLTADALAVRIVLSSRSPAEQARRLQSLRATVAHMVGANCPDCGGTNILDNGCSGRQASFRCEDCGHGWDAAY